MIAVTGVGAVSAAGEGVEALVRGLESGGVPLRASPWGAGQGVHSRGEPATTAQLALAAAREATEGLADPSTLAVVGASTSGHMSLGERALEASRSGGEFAPLDLLWSQLCHEPTQAVAAALGSQGPRLTASTACTSGAVALGLAADLVRDQRAPAALVVGADALCQTTVRGFSSLGVYTATSCRPFAEDRDGMCIGEGAGALLLEDAERARARGARILALVLGYGNASDAHHLSTPHPEGRGARAAIAAALGERDPREVDLAVAHGTGTLLNDAMESAVLADLFPGAAVAAYKGYTGHTLGAAAAVEAVLAVHALATGVIPPSTGAGPSPDLDLVLAPRASHPRLALSVNFAFGGNCTAVLLGAP